MILIIILMILIILIIFLILRLIRYRFYFIPTFDYNDQYPEINIDNHYTIYYKKYGLSLELASFVTK